MWRPVGGSGGLFGPQDDHSHWNPPTPIETETGKEFANNFRKKAEKRGVWGSLPGNITRSLEQLLKPVVRWQKLLRRFVGEAIRIDIESTRMRPHRRLGWDYPGRKIVRSGVVWVAVDNSGSISNLEAARFFGEMSAFVDLCDLVLVVWDTAITGAARMRSRGDLIRAAKNLGGGGGTEVACVFEALAGRRPNLPPAALSALRKRPNALVVLTDGHLDFPGPEVRHPPTLWAITDETMVPGPKFGISFHLPVKKGA